MHLEILAFFEKSTRVRHYVNVSWWVTIHVSPTILLRPVPLSQAKLFDGEIVSLVPLAFDGKPRITGTQPKTENELRPKVKKKSY